MDILIKKKSQKCEIIFCSLYLLTFVVMFWILTYYVIAVSLFFISPFFMISLFKNHTRDYEDYIKIGEDFIEIKDKDEYCTIALSKIEKVIFKKERSFHDGLTMFTVCDYHKKNVDVVLDNYDISMDDFIKLLLSKNKMLNIEIVKPNLFSI